MATIWDSSPYLLPTQCLAGSFNESKQDGVIRTNMDMGYPKLRPRYTSVLTNYQARYFITSTQRIALDALYVAKMGTTFTWPHPVTGTSMTVRFVSPPSYQAAAVTDVYASVSLEGIP